MYAYTCDMSASSGATRSFAHRSEDAMRALLESLEPALKVQTSQSHGRNDCLTDSILLALADQGLIKPLDKQQRGVLCTNVRRDLETSWNLSPHNNPFLSHDDHFHPICEKLRETLEPLWVPPESLSQTAFTCIVYDRFNRQTVQDATGEFTEIEETNPVHASKTTG